MRITNKKIHYGFTLTELLITVTILGLLSAAAFPSLADMMRKNRISSLASDLKIALYTAQSEAIKRNTTVTLARDAKVGSDSRSWGDGWKIFVDSNNNGSYKASDGDTLIHHHTFSHSGFRIRKLQPSGASGNKHKKSISFDALGSPVSYDGDFFICPSAATKAEANKKGKTVEVSLSGNVVVKDEIPFIAGWKCPVI